MKKLQNFRLEILQFRFFFVPLHPQTKQKGRLAQLV